MAKNSDQYVRFGIQVPDMEGITYTLTLMKTDHNV